MEAGFRKPLCHLELTDKPVIRGVLLLDYHLVKSTWTNLRRAAMRAHPTLFKSLFVYCEKNMSAGKVIITVRRVTIDDRQSYRLG